jgi:hypothetical protein
MLTILTAPEPLSEDADCRAFHNAVLSWLRFSDEIFVFDKTGSCDVDELGCFRLDDFETRQPATLPYLDDMLTAGQGLASYEFLMYVTSHLIFVDDLLPLVQVVADRFPGPFLIVSQSAWDLAVNETLTFGYGWVDQLWVRVQLEATPFDLSAQDFFILRKDTLGLDIRHFVAGRQGYNTWLVWAALQADMPVVSITDACLVIHQRHRVFHPRSRTALECEADAQYNVSISGWIDADFAGGPTHEVLRDLSIIEREG